MRMKGPASDRRVPEALFGAGFSKPIDHWERPRLAILDIKTENLLSDSEFTLALRDL